MVRRLFTLIVMASSVAARAQAPGSTEADAQFMRGKDLLAQGKTAEACAAFDASQKLDPSVSTLVNQANCREKNGQLATALSLFREAERQTRAAADDETQALHGVVADRSTKLEARVSKLTIRVPQTSQISGLEILRDTTPVDTVQWNVDMPIDGGTYTVTARVRGASTWTDKVTLANEGDHKTVEIPDLRNHTSDQTVPPTSSGVTPTVPARVSPKPPAAPAAEPTEAPPTIDTGTSSSRSLVLPIAVGGVAIALLGGALAFEIMGRGTYEDAMNEMASQPRRDELEDSANTKHYVAQGLAVAGIATAGVAVWSYLRGREKSAPASETARTVVVSPTGIALIGWF